MSKIRIGIFQLHSHPAVSLAERDLLMEPVFPFAANESITEVVREAPSLRDGLRAVREKYLSWQGDRILCLLDWLSKRPCVPQIVVFPECSIPYELLIHFKHTAEALGIVFFAGTHSPRSDKAGLSFYKNVLGVRNRDLKDFKESPPPAVLPIIRKDQSFLHRKSVPSVFELDDVAAKRPRPVRVEKFQLQEANCTIMALVCAEALHLLSHSDGEAPDIAIITAFEREPSRFNPFVDTLLANKIPVVIANDGVYGGSGIFTNVDQRTANWWNAPPNHGRLPKGEAYLEMEIDLSSPAIQVGVASPSQSARLTQCIPILYSDSPILQFEQKLAIAVESCDSTSMMALRAESISNSGIPPLYSRRQQLLESLIENGGLSDTWKNSVGSHLLIPRLASLPALQCELGSLLVGTIEKLLASPEADSLTDTAFRRLSKIRLRFTKSPSLPQNQLQATISTTAPIGRSAEIEALRKFCNASSGAVYVITGLEAVGKSTVIDTAVQQSGCRVLDISCFAGISADFIFESIFRSGGRTPADNGPRHAFPDADIRDAMTNTEVLLLRNCHFLCDHGIWRTKSIESLFQSLFRCVSESRVRLILECRHALTLNTPMGFQVVRRRIEGLQPDDAVAFLSQQIRRADGGPQIATEQDKQEIARLTHGHPGLLILCADVLVLHGTTHVLRELQARRGFYLHAVKQMLISLGLSENTLTCIGLLCSCRRPIPYKVFEATFEGFDALTEAVDACLALHTSFGYQVSPILTATDLDDVCQTRQRYTTFHTAATKHFKQLSTSLDRSIAFNATVEANYHATLAGITLPFDLRGLPDAVGGAVHRAFELQHYNEVIDLLKGIDAQLLPEDLLAMLARAYAWNNSFPEAFRICDIVVKQNRDYVTLYSEACRAAIRARNWDVARDALRRAEALEPGFYQIHSFRGQIAEHERKLDDAIKHYELAVEASDKDPWPYFYLTRAFVRRGLPEKALDVADSAHKFADEMRHRNFESALLSQELLAVVMSGRIEIAESLLDAIDSRDTLSPEFLITAAYVRAYLENNTTRPDVMKIFDAALTKLRNNDSRKAHVQAKIQMYRGKLLHRLHNLRDAETAFSAACAKDPHNVHMKECLIKVLKEIAREAKDSGEEAAEESAARRAVDVANEILAYDNRNNLALNILEDMIRLHGIER